MTPRLNWRRPNRWRSHWQTRRRRRRRWNTSRKRNVGREAWWSRRWHSPCWHRRLSAWHRSRSHHMTSSWWWIKNSHGWSYHPSSSKISMAYSSGRVWLASSDHKPSPWHAPLREPPWSPPLRVGRSLEARHPAPRLKSGVGRWPTLISWISSFHSSLISVSNTTSRMKQNQKCRCYPRK